MCRLEQPSLTVEAEPENVLNTASPGRTSSWILPSEMMIPMRPTTGGLQTPTDTVQVQSFSNIAIDMTYLFHLRNGGIETFEQKMMSLNCLEVPFSQEENSQETASSNIYSRRTRTSCKLQQFQKQHRAQTAPIRTLFDV